MIESSLKSEVQDSDERTESFSREAESGKKKKSLSMHDDVPVWCDCCTCEAEPYWIEMMEKSKLD